MANFTRPSRSGRGGVRAAGQFHHTGDEFGRVTIDFWKHPRVCIRSERAARVTQAVGHDRERHVGGEGVRGVGVAQSVEHDPWQAGLLAEGSESPADRLWMDRRAVLSAEHKVELVVPGPPGETLSVLGGPM